MESASYRITTYCPEQMSNKLKKYLSKNVDGKKKLAVRDVIAMNLLRPFEDSFFPFCCSFIGWSAPGYKEQLENMFIKLNNLTVSNNDEPISIEGFGVELEQGYIQIAGAYPLLDIQDNIRMSEYQKVSFIHNKPLVDELFSWIHENLIAGAIESDNIGIICTILGESNELLDIKLQEILSLLADTEYQVREEPDILEDLFVVLLCYVHHIGAHGGYIFRAGYESQVISEVKEIAENVTNLNQECYELIESNYDIEQLQFIIVNDINDLYDLNIDGSDVEGESVRVLFIGKGLEGITGLLEFLINDIEDKDSKWLWNDPEEQRSQLINLKHRLAAKIDHKFIQDLANLIPFIS